MKIGKQDAFAFPELLPGSIVRVKPLYQSQRRPTSGKVPHNTLFLVEHGRGFVCSQICRPEQDRIVLCQGICLMPPPTLKKEPRQPFLGSQTRK
jgi:hypothetical protein